MHRTDGVAGRTTRGVLAVVAIGLAAALTAPAALGTAPGASGRIAFHRDDADGYRQIWTANPDLTAEEQLTTVEATSGWPAWSPSGTHIAFDSDRADPDTSDDLAINDIFTMRADGTDVRKLTDSTDFSGDAAYSPDGRWIAFDSDRDGRQSIYLMRPDGSDVRRITAAPAGTIDSEPAFSPDGRQLVFARIQNGQTNPHGRTIGDPSTLFVVNVDGTGLRRIVGWGERVDQSSWSPDGRWIAYEDACCYRGNADLYVVNPITGGHAKLTTGHGITGTKKSFQLDGYYDPVWSPDGTTVLFGRQFIDEAGVYHEGLALIAPDGTNMRWAGSGFDFGHQPDWGTAPLK